MTDTAQIIVGGAIGGLVLLVCYVLAYLTTEAFPTNPFNRGGYVSRNSLHHTIWPRHPANYPAKLAVKKYREAFKRHVNDEETHQTPNGGNAQ